MILVKKKKSLFYLYIKIDEKKFEHWSDKCMGHEDYAEVQTLD